MRLGGLPAAHGDDVGSMLCVQEVLFIAVFEHLAALGSYDTSLDDFFRTLSIHVQAQGPYQQNQSFPSSKRHLRLHGLLDNHAITIRIASCARVVFMHSGDSKLLPITRASSTRTAV